MQNLITDHMYIVPRIARQYYIPSLWREDILQEGYYGLCIAARHYRPQFPTRSSTAPDAPDAPVSVSFASYASWWVRKYIIEALRSYGQIVRLPRHELPEHIYTEPLDKPCRIEDDEVLTYQDILPGGESAETTLLLRQYQELFARRLSLLSPREQQVLCLSLGLENPSSPVVGEPLSTQEIARRMSLSVRQVQRLLKNVRDFL